VASDPETLADKRRGSRPPLPAVQWRSPSGSEERGKGAGLACSVCACQDQLIDPVSIPRLGLPFLFRGWGWGRLPGGGRRDPLLFRPEGAKTNQPRAKRRGDSRRATPWVRYRFSTVALKGRNKSLHPTRIVRQLRQGLFRPFRAGVLPPLLTQGGATRLRRSALPWADM
jgi:hypothetical protein